MTPGPLLIAARRRALVDQVDKTGGPGRLLLLDADGGILVSIELAQPCGVVDEAGVSISTTEYAQITSTGSVASARLVDGSGGLVGDLVTGISTDIPIPELPLPSVVLLAGAFIRLIGSHINCD